MRLLTAAAAAFAVSATLLTATPASADAGAYEFPTRPGTARWAALPTHDDMLRATQLPAGVAESMSTEALVTTVLDYPLLLDALTFNSVQHGIDTVAGRFNGLAELLARPDAGTVLLRRYRHFDARVPAKASELEAGDHTVAAWKLEMLLAQPEVLGTLTATQLEAVLRTGLAKFEAKEADASFYGKAGLEPTAALLGRALTLREGRGYQDSPLLRDAISPSAAALDEVATMARRHLGEPGARAEAGVQDFSATVYTPHNSPVTVQVMTYELTAAQITSYNNWVAANYPNAVRETNASRRYNCHSYTWFTTSPLNDVWMYSPGNKTYWLDGSYIRWQVPYPYHSSMKWDWAVGDHSGIETEVPGFIRSKWGQLGRMYHWWSYSPYDDSVMNQYFPS